MTKYQSQSGKRRRAALFGIILLAAGVGAGWYLWPLPAPAVDVSRSLTVVQGDVEDTVSALGSLQPRDYVDVGVQVSGQLKRLHVDIGSLVAKGDLLGEIDPALQQARVDAGRAQLLAQRAQLVERQAQLRLAEQQWARQKRLHAEQASSEEALQSSEANVTITRAQIDALKAQIQQSESSLKADEATLGYTRIYAPMSGTVVQLLAREGQTLNTNQQAPLILRIADLSSMTVWTQVSEADVARLRPGMPVYFNTLGATQRWQGELRQILPTPEVLNNVVLYTALFDVDNPEQRLMTQMTAQVFFVVGAARDVPLVPQAALTPVRAREGLYRTAVVDAQGRIEARDVRIGVSNRLQAEVLDGLAPGDRVLPANPGGLPNARGNGSNTSASNPMRFRGFP